MEKSLIILKPDCIKKKLSGVVISRFEKKGFYICGIKLINLSKELLKEHYSHIKSKSFFPEIITYMQSSPVIVMVLEGNNVISSVREMLGPTNSSEAEKGTIRGDFGEGTSFNVCHASDSIQSANEEISRFFKEEELFSTKS